MANASVQKSSGSPLSKVAMGPKLIGLGAVLYVLTRIVKALPLGWIDGPLLGLLWLGILASVAAGIGLIVLKSKRS